jgi:hypothetical protein
MVDLCVRIVLAAAFLACPFFCTGYVNGAGGEARATAEQSCCCKCRGPQLPAEQPSSSCPDDEPGKSSCQCICGGAVVENQRSVGNHDQLDQSVAMPAPSMSAAGNSAQGGPPIGALPQEQRATPGRAIRCLYMSLLL